MNSFRQTLTPKRIRHPPNKIVPACDPDAVSRIMIKNFLQGLKEVKDVLKNTNDWSKAL